MNLASLIEQTQTRDYALIVLSRWDMQHLQEQLLPHGTTADNLIIGRTRVVYADVQRSFAVEGYPELTLHYLR